MTLEQVLDRWLQSHQVDHPGDLQAASPLAVAVQSLFQCVSSWYAYATGDLRPHFPQSVEGMLHTLAQVQRLIEAGAVRALVIGSIDNDNTTRTVAAGQYTRLEIIGLLFRTAHTFDGHEETLIG